MEHDDEQPRDDLDESDDAQNDPATPHRTFRQLLHWATGDRDAEAAALADASPEEVTVEDAVSRFMALRTVPMISTPAMT